MNIYPDRDLEELYIENQSVWDEVFAGERTAESALEYLQVEPDSVLGNKAYESLTSGNAPL